MSKEADAHFEMLEKRPNDEVTLEEEIENDKTPKDEEASPISQNDKLDAEKSTGSEVMTEPSKPPMPPIPDFPEGGLRAWLVVLGAWLTLFSTFGYLNSYGAYQDFYQVNQLKDYSPSTISWIGSMQVFGMFFFSLVSGPLFDKGYFRQTVFVGSVVLIVSIFMTSLCKRYWQFFLAQGVGQSIGMGLLFFPAVGIASHYFRRRRAYAMGFITTGSAVGGVVFPILLNNLFHPHGESDSTPSTNHDFKTGVQSSGYIVLAFMVIANVLMKPRLPPMKRNLNHWKVIKKCLTEPISVFAFMGSFLVLWGLFYPVFYMEEYAISKGISDRLSFYSITILNAGSVPGRLIPPYIADKVGPFNVTIPCGIMCGILIFVLLSVHTGAGLVPFTFIYGIFVGGYVSVIIPALVSLADGFAEIGLRMAVYLPIIGLAGLTGTPICGALLARNGQWVDPTIFAATSALLGSFFLLVARYLLSRKRGTQKL